MGKIAEVQEVPVEKLIPYVNNAKMHSDEQVTMIASSIREFGFLSPVLIDRNFNVIAGHGRIAAAKKLDLKEIPCVYVEGLTDAQRKAYILADNKLTELGDWNMELVACELEALKAEDFNIDLTGFNLDDIATDWFNDHERGDKSRQEGNDEYNEFLDKFETKKTTDDCYTPDNIYDGIAGWVEKEYNVNRLNFIRPFYPGGDYQKENYTGKIVVDNPPFSILSEIIDFYESENVKYFLFSPAVSCFNNSPEVTTICVGVNITYENGAIVPTSFNTNLDESGTRVRTAPDLYKIINDINKENTKGKQLPVYKYPPTVITAAQLSYLSKYGQDLRIKVVDTYPKKIGALDSQKEQDKCVFGGCFFISEKAAAEKAAAEKAAAEKAAAIVWELSDREKEIIKSLGDHNEENKNEDKTNTPGTSNKAPGTSGRKRRKL